MNHSDPLSPSGGNTERLLCLDVGDRRIGLAVSDPLGIFATPHSVLERVGWGPDIRRIRAVMEEKGCTRIICGLPRNMDGSEGFQSRKVMEFAQKLQESGIPVEFTDERLSTVEAENALLEGGMHRSDRKTHVDMVAAAVILQRYLDKRSNEKAARQRAEKEESMTDDKSRPDPEEILDDGEDSQIIELTDENGETSQFEYLTTIDHEGKLYVVLMLLDENGQEIDDEEGEVIVLEIQKDENGEDIYVSVDDEDVSDAVFQKFMAMVEEQEDDE